MQKLNDLRNLLAFIDDIVADKQIPDLCERRIVGFTILDCVNYYAKGINVLLEQNLPTPAFSLLRILFEGYVRGMWMLHCASDEQVTNFRLEDKILDSSGKPIHFGTLAEEVDAKFGTPDFLSQLKEKSWKIMNSYTHSGFVQILSHYDKQTLEPNYKDEEIEQIIFQATTFATLAFCQFLDVFDIDGKDSIAKVLEQKLEPLKNR